MLKESETEETIIFFVSFSSLVVFQLGGRGPVPLGLPDYAYGYKPSYVSSNILGPPLGNLFKIASPKIQFFEPFKLGRYRCHFFDTSRHLLSLTNATITTPVFVISITVFGIGLKNSFGNKKTHLVRSVLNFKIGSKSILNRK